MCVPEAEPCNCEHASHFDSTLPDHPYREASAGHLRAMFVGLVCDSCAQGHMKEFIGK
ncbi:MAG: hypothetical protein IJI97_05905 [Clostridia bacterium]|nr:hypothetical protein [Clostridia bacterium]